MSTPEILKQTPLFEIHRQAKAKMMPFGGWDMPLQYEGILSEYESTRRGCAVFDTSHMGEFCLSADPHESGLDHLLTVRVSDMPIKTCRYAMMLNDQGGVLDDLIVYRLAPSEWMIVVNAGTINKDFEHFRRHLKGKFSLRNVSSETGKLDIQGPRSRDVLSRFISGLDALKFYSFDIFSVLGEKVIVSRTGYTGELGFEIYCPWNKTAELWREIFKSPSVKPAGLGARDILRLEMGYSLYGHELDETILPLEAGLKRFVDLDHEFIGREALVRRQKEGTLRSLVCFTSLTRKAPRAGQPLLSTDKQKIGLVTSGSFSPALNLGIGMGLISSVPPAQGAILLVGDEKNIFNVAISNRPFYKGGSLKQ